MVLECPDRLSRSGVPFVGIRSPSRESPNGQEEERMKVSESLGPEAAQYKQFADYSMVYIMRLINRIAKPGRKCSSYFLS